MPKMLLVAVGLEVAVFAAIAPHFLTVGNLFEVVRFSVELGLLAIALTPVIVSGGIDLSVGSMLGLSAVVFGAAYHDWGFPLAGAAIAALVTGALGGALNGASVAFLRIPPLIVTLGSLALFRGIAEGVTHAAVNYSGFPSQFLALGQGYLWGVVPAQVPIVVIVFGAYFLLLHRAAFGRALFAIGLSPSGARYAGLPVARRVAVVYVLSGVVASAAAIIYVAHLGQAKADAGTGYELDAIAAVVLGGASIAGGIGSLWGTLLGLFAISILQNGLQLAALPSELVGMLTGSLLVGSVIADRWWREPRVRERFVDPSSVHDEVIVKNSQVAVLCAAVMAGALIVSGTNVWLVRSLRPDAAGPSGQPRSTGRRLVIAMMPKAKGDPYFISCRAGAEEAANELGIDLIWDGPTSLDAAKQNEMIENWITRRVDAIAVAVENREGISTVLKKARERGIPVLTWDADANPDARDFFVNQATAEGIGNTLADEGARLVDESGAIAIVTGALTAANQNEWIAFIKKRLADKYPNVTLATIRPSDDDRDKAFAETQTIMKAYPDVKLVVAISAPAVPGAAEAVRQSGRTDVRVIGLSLPNMNKPYVHAGVVQTVVLWDTKSLGYLAVYASAMAADHRLAAGASAIEAGRLGRIEVRGSQVILGPPLKFTADNIDRFDF
jgi:rhamnose transport system substrate-binding protein